MPKFYESEEFKQLNTEWQEKLAKSGFVDAEETVGSDTKLKQNSENAYRQASLVEREARVAYFNFLIEHVQFEEFPNKADKLIMTRRSQGMKIKDISEELKKRGFKSHRQTIRFTIRKYETKWHIRKWQPHQMKSK